MRLTIFTHKEVYNSKKVVGQYETSGGFPYQIKHMSKLFSNTTLICTLRESKVNKDFEQVKGKNLKVIALPEPLFRGHMRHLFLIFWVTKYFWTFHRKIKRTDCVHALVPGDIGLVGLLLTLFYKKPIFIRHCGTWGNKTTIADKFLYWLMLKIAKKNNVIMATGGGELPPEKNNKDIKWIFSTSINSSEWVKLKQAKPWVNGEKLKLITVARLTKEKNIHSIIKSLPIIRKSYNEIELDIIGDGPEMNQLKLFVSNQKLEKHVRLLGQLEHSKIIDKLSNSHLFVFPTNTKEGFPKALLEAMACGLPSIASRVSVIPFLIEDECGWVLNETNEVAISEAVIHMINTPSKMESMGKSARKKSEIYTLENWEKLIYDRLRNEWGPLS